MKLDQPDARAARPFRWPVRQRLGAARDTLRAAAGRRLRVARRKPARLLEERPHGFIDGLDLDGGRVHVTGWTHASRLRISTEASCLELEPGLPRPDLPPAWCARGFSATVEGRKSMAVLSDGEEVAVVDLAHVGRSRGRQQFQPIRLSQPRPFGYIDLIEIANGRTRVAGWTRARVMKVSTEAQTIEISPGLPRADVPAEVEAMGFDVEVVGLERLTLDADGMEPLTICVAGPWHWCVASMRALGAVLKVPVLHGGALLAWTFTGNEAAGQRLQNALAPPLPLLHQPAASEGIFAQAGEHPPALDEPVDIIIPVYNAWEVVAECLDRVARHTSPRHRVIVIDDASTEAEIPPILDEFAAKWPNARILRQTKNAGFIASVNLGLAEARGHVVLLNTDAFVPDGWVERLVAPILSDGSVATVTPMTNNGEIASAPVICRAEALSRGMADKIDANARTLHPVRATTDAPTGVGFCMAMARPWLDRIPQLDASLGHGYGEEVDWCQRVARLGARHVLSGALFVEHRGGVSFGKEKRQWIARANAIISRRYPAYDRDVQSFIRSDPAIGARLVAGIARMGLDDRLPIYLANHVDGGSRQWLAERIRARLDIGASALVIREGRTSRDRVGIELHCPGGVTEGTVPRSELGRYLAAAPHKEVVYSNLVGAQDALGTLGLVAGCLRPGDRLRVVFHDHFPLCPSYNLLGADGQFCGLPEAGACQACYERLEVRIPSRPDTIAAWRAGWAAWLERADAIEVFSASSRDLVTRVWPGIATKVTVRPHEMRSLPGRLRPRRSGPPAVGVLGAIGYEKGAAVLRDLAAHAGDRLNIVVIGEMDMAYHHPAIAVHGRYDRSEIESLARRYGIDQWLFPSICPETFSYSVRECLATGLPVFAFDLGAQAEAARAAPNGVVLPLCGADELLEALVGGGLDDRDAMRSKAACG